MAYQALYRQWRPQTFSAMVGQEAVIATLRNQIMTGRIAHAYLFCGSRGTGKTSTAKIMARAINCLAPVQGDPCGQCESCLRLMGENSLDVLEIDAASNNGVDEIRDLRESVKYPPQYGKYKVYIIDEVHMLSASAFNALLKTLEEPPAHAVFILAKMCIRDSHSLGPSNREPGRWKQFLPMYRGPHPGRGHSMHSQWAACPHTPSAHPGARWKARSGWKAPNNHREAGPDNPG